MVQVLHRGFFIQEYACQNEKSIATRARYQVTIPSELGECLEVNSNSNQYFCVWLNIYKCIREKVNLTAPEDPSYAKTTTFGNLTLKIHKSVPSTVILVVSGSGCPALFNTIWYNH